MSIRQVYDTTALLSISLIKKIESYHGIRRITKALGKQKMKRCSKCLLPEMGNFDLTHQRIRAMANRVRSF